MVFTVDLGPIDRNVYNVGGLIDDDYISISTYILNVVRSSPNYKRLF